MENWKSVVGFEGYYEVSSEGRIKSVERLVKSPRGCGQVQLKERLKSLNHSRSYLSCSIHKEGKPYCFTVHRLVAIAFIPNPENKEQVNHIDGNKTNNKAKNLEWVTCSENHLHAYKTGLSTSLKGEANPRSKLTTKLVQEAKDLRELGHTYKSIAQLIGISVRHAQRIIIGERWSDSAQKVR